MKFILIALALLAMMEATIMVKKGGERMPLILTSGLLRRAWILDLITLPGQAKIYCSRPLNVLYGGCRLSLHS
jgi:hypothetical protein